MYEPRFAPYRRVATLSVALLSLMVMVVGLGALGVTQMRSGFDRLVEDDFPRFDHLLHIDRDLFRGQGALRDAMLAETANDRLVYIDEYEHQVERTGVRWESYLEVSAGGAEELEWQREHDVAREAWIASTGALAESVRLDPFTTPGGVSALLDQSQEDFWALRTIVHDLEELVGEPLIAQSSADVTATADKTIAKLFGLLAFGLLVGGIISFTTYRAARLQHWASIARERERSVDAERSAFESELNQALDMAQSEEAAVGTVQLALVESVTDRYTELLLADSSHAHLRQVVSTDPGSYASGCSVIEPGDCPAVRRGTTLEFPSSASFSACPHLQSRGVTPCSAVCVPVSVAGRSAGVMHSTGPEGESPDSAVIFKLERLADRAGDRVGVLRAFAQSQTQAATDPLTGLLNRRSFENHAGDMLRSGHRFALGYGDLDHFKLLNDRHGHDTGDRALRLFARVLTDSLREGDVAARWGGEEFVVLFADSDAATATGALDRLRENLMVALAGANSAPFTVSFGTADSMMATELDELVGIADVALLEAKRRGRDRVIMAGSTGAESEDAADAAASTTSQP